MRARLYARFRYILFIFFNGALNVTRLLMLITYKFLFKLACQPRRSSPLLSRSFMPHGAGSKRRIKEGCKGGKRNERELQKSRMRLKTELFSVMKMIKCAVKEFVSFFFFCFLMGYILMHMGIKSIRMKEFGCFVKFKKVFFILKICGLLLSDQTYIFSGVFKTFWQ